MMCPWCNTWPERVQAFGEILLSGMKASVRAGMVVAVLAALGACQAAGGSANDHPYRDLRSGPNIGGF